MTRVRWRKPEFVSRLANIARRLWMEMRIRWLLGRDGWPPDDQVARKAYHTRRAAVLAPRLSLAHLALLNDDETDTTPALLKLLPASLSRTPSPAFSCEANAKPDRGSGKYLDVYGNPLHIDESLPAPDVAFRLEEDGRPIAGMSPVTAPAGSVVSYCFEFDTSASFDTPNCWSYPPLLPQIVNADLPDRSGLSYYALFTTLRGLELAREPHCRWRFPPSAMILPARYGEITFGHLERVALALGCGLATLETVEAVFAHIHLRYAWAADSVYRPPLDVFRGGLGGCGHVNNLMALMLELNGVRTRGVAGFDPELRAILPGSGHSAIEFLNPISGSWEYLDGFFGIWLKGRSAQDLPDDLEAQRMILGRIRAGQGSETREREYSLADLFRYRTYFDFASRLPMLSMLRLNGDEKKYGRRWNLIRPSACAQQANVWNAAGHDLHMRARYILAETSIAHAHLPFTVAPVASRWATAALRTGN